MGILYWVYFQWSSRVLLQMTCMFVNADNMNLTSQDPHSDWSRDFWR